jgi:shikimate dehydrogenase
MHAAALKALNLPGEYRLFPAPPAPYGDEAIRGLFEKMRRGEMHGLNVTIPHKQTVIPYLDELTPTALAVGAVNTIVYKAGKLVGENTDCPGFLADLAVQLESAGLRDLCDRTGNSALVLGAGGSARAVVFGLLHIGWQVSIAARRPEQAHELMRFVASRPMLVGDLHMLRSKAAQNIQLIVNTTPLGMHPNVDDSPWPADLPFPKKVFIYDLVYNPPETALLRSARNSGLPAANGIGMLVRQAVLSFRAWTGLEPPWEVMYQAVAAYA